MDIWAVVALIVMLIGLVGILAPIVPGVGLIWGALLVYCLIDGFQQINGWLFALLTLLSVAGLTAELWVSSLSGKAGGASGWALVAGLILSVLGLIFFSIPGAVLGALIGVLGVQLWKEKDWRKGLKASGGWLVGWLFSFVVQLVAGLIVIAVFVWRTLLPGG